MELFWRELRYSESGGETGGKEEMKKSNVSSSSEIPKIVSALIFLVDLKFCDLCRPTTQVVSALAKLKPHFQYCIGCL